MKFRDKPAIKSQEDTRKQEEIATRIISEADKPASARASQVIGAVKEPWEEIEEEKEIVVFSFRVPRRDMQKLKYISRETKISINTICLSSIREYNKKKLNELKKEW
ncbi:MAG: hypothetical protein KAT71_01640 [Gammaproteobacteria bacterium]|nr:hypothetical protein [Gammaproteobacteria bacterium]